MIFNNVIEGSSAKAGLQTENVSPSDISDKIGLFAQGCATDVDEAVEAAATAFDAWSRSSPQLRHDILQTASAEVFARREELGQILSREEGKILSEGIGEVTRAAQVLSFFAGECLRIGGEAIASVRHGVGIEIQREPLGVIGLITPWNFPIAIPAWKIAPALAYGNTVVIKPAEICPHSTWMLVDVLNRAGLPDGVLNLVMGRGSVVGQAIVEHPKVSAISFTGSVATGQRIAASCVASQPMKKVQLEMGGKNPFVVLDDACLDTAVDCALNGAFFSTGQRCTASSRLIVAESVHDAFVARLREKMETLTVGHALNPDTLMGPVVSQAQLDQNLSYLEIGQSEGATLEWGGERFKASTDGYFMQPALFVDVDNAMRIAREEIFGPIASVIRVRDYDEALDVANATEFGLSAGICTTSLKYATDFRQNAQAGMVMVNLPTAGVDYHVAFGGSKASSYGAREQGSYAREFYTTIKTSYTKAG